MILNAILKILIGVGVYVFIMLSLTVAVSAGVCAGLRNYFDKNLQNKRRK